jgi:Bacterial membrane protein YfhO
MEPTWPPGYARRALHACATVVVLIAAAFSPFLFGGASLMAASAQAPSLYADGALPKAPPGPYRTVLDPGAAAWQIEPWLAVEHRSGPWWDPFDGYGQPYAASQQTQPFFPLTYLASRAPSPRAWAWFAVGRLMLAGVFGALFVSWFGGRAAAVAGGIGAALSGYYLLYLGMPHLSVEVLVAALLWATEWLVRRPGPGSIAAVALVIGAQFQGGMPESIVIAVMSAFAYVAIRLAIERRLAIVPFLPFAAAATLGAAAGATIILPLLEVLKDAFDMHRTASFVDGLAADGLPPLKVALIQLIPLAYGLPFEDISQGGRGYSGQEGFIGTVVALGAVVACAAAFRRGTTRALRGAIVALTIIVAFFLLKNYGLPLVNWVGALPVLRLVIFPKYDQAVIGTACGLLCGLGVAALEQHAARRRDVVLALGLLVVLLTAAYLNAVGAIPRGPHGRIFFVACGGGLVALLLAAAALTVPPRLASRGRIAFAAVLVAVAFAQFYVPVYSRFARTAPISADPYAVPPYAAALRERLGASHDRVLALGGMLAPNWGGALGFETPNALNAIYPGRYLPFIDAFIGLPEQPADEDRRNRFTGFSDPRLDTASARRWLTLSSVRYVVVPAHQRLRGDGLRLVYDRDARLYEYAAPLPRAAVFHDVRMARDGDEALRVLRDPALDVRRTLVLEGSGQPAAGAPGSASTEGATIVSSAPERVAIDASLDRAGYVMLNDTAYEGWTATVDDAPAPIERADALFRAVAVPTGRHRITFTYRSRAIAAGIAVNVAGLLVIAGCIVAAAARRRGSP